MREVLLEPMVEDALKKSRAYRFKNREQAHLFMRVCFKKSLEDCGVFCPPKLPTEAERQIALNKLMTANQVRVERNRQVLMGDWFNALYIFKHGELVSFTTEPKQEQPSVMSTEKFSAWTVRTNVKL